MPRLTCTFRRFISIIEEHGFEVHRQGTGSHIRWRGVVGGRVMLVDVAFHRRDDEIRPGTLKSMIRQSGLPKALFRR